MSEEIYLYPEQLTIDPQYNTRLWPLDDDAKIAESSLVARLASSIESQGQFDSCVCVVDPARPLPHVLVTGQRRRRAIAEINQKRSDDPDHREPLMKIRCRIDNTGRDMFRIAALSNIHNNSMSPIEVGCLIHHLRRKAKYRTINEGSEAIGKYLDMDYSIVKQTERLLRESDPAIRAALHAGTIGKAAAQDLLKALDSKRVAVLKLATELEANRKLTDAQFKRVKYQRQNDTASLVKRITRTSVAKAVEQLGAGVSPVSRTRSDIIHLIAALDVPERGCIGSEVRIWARLMVGWIKGLETTESVQTAFNVMTKTAYRGRHSAADDYEAERIRERKYNVATNRRSRRTKLKPKPKFDPMYQPATRGRIYKEADDSVLTI